jgi:hypothetical protein
VRPGEKPPVFPELAKQHTANGAIAFAAYYFTAYDWGYATNDPTLIEDISSPTCRGCAKFVDGLRGLASQGGTLMGGRIKVRSRGLRHGQFRYEADFVVGVRVDETPIYILRPHAQRSKAAPAIANRESLVFVSWVSNRWQVDEVAAP